MADDAQLPYLRAEIVEALRAGRSRVPLEALGTLSEQERRLIELLLDRDARVDERDDAAMDLENYSGREVEAALARVACDPAEAEVLLASAGESLAGIWARTGSPDAAVFGMLAPAARAEARALLRSRAPHLLHALGAAPS